MRREMQSNAYKTAARQAIRCELALQWKDAAKHWRLALPLARGEQTIHWVEYRVKFCERRQHIEKIPDSFVSMKLGASYAKVCS